MATGATRRFGEALHGLAQRLLTPAAFRSRFGDESRQAFADLYADARRRGGLARGRLLARELGGMVRLAWRERVSASGGRGPQPAPGASPGGGAAGIGDDVRFALRLLRREPVYTATAILTLVIGLTVTGGSWALLRGALVRPLPFAEDNRLVQVWSVRSASRGQETYTTSVPDYLDLRARSDGLLDLAAHNRFSATITGAAGEAERVMGAVVTPNLFDVLGVTPALGRGMTAAHGEPGQDAVVLLGHDYWRARFGADAGVVGSELLINGAPRTVLGVLPEGFQLPDPYRPLETVPLYVPFAFTETHETAFTSRYLRLVGRLSPGATAESATGELQDIAAALAASRPDSNFDVSTVAIPLRTEFFGASTPMLLLVQGAGLAVLLIAVVNLANLTLVRGRRRRGELAVRAALGAGSRRLARQMVTEGSVLAAIGGVLAVGTLFALEGPLRGLAGSYLPRIARVEIDGGVVAALAGLAAVTGILLGVLAVADLGRGAEGGLVREAGRSAGRVSSRTRSGLVIAEIAFALTLVLVAGLLTRSLLALAAVPTGFDSNGVLMFEVEPPADRYQSGDKVRDYFRRLEERIAAITGIAAVGAASDPPFVSEDRSRHIDFAAEPLPHAEQPSVEYRTVTAGYFGAMEIPLLAGRGFDPTDGAETPLVLVANETFALRWGGGVAAAPGQRLLIGLGGDEASELEVVGIVGDERDDGFAGELEPILYFLHEQVPVRRMTLMLRADGEPSALAPAAREAVASIDPEVAVTGLQPLRGLLAANLADKWLSAWLAGGSALLGVLLAGIGIYGVMGYQVATRTREIGVRTALGARPRTVVREVLGDVLILTSIGVGLGLAVGALAARWLGSLLFGIGALDPVTFVLAPLALAAVALLAGAIPARRAARVSPVVALRN